MTPSEDTPYIDIEYEEFYLSSVQDTATFARALKAMLQKVLHTFEGDVFVLGMGGGEGVGKTTMANIILQKNDADKTFDVRSESLPTINQDFKKAREPSDYDETGKVFKSIYYDEAYGVVLWMDASWVSDGETDNIIERERFAFANSMPAAGLRGLNVIEHYECSEREPTLIIDFAEDDGFVTIRLKDAQKLLSQEALKGFWEQVKHLCKYPEDREGQIIRLKAGEGPPI